jgi:hypothetical protein
MAVIHQTTMTPTKLELLAAWLPGQPWFIGAGRAPDLARVGGFRLDDPRGEVGIEFMVVTDQSADPPTTYHVPMSYRGKALDAINHALIGTAEHGVLGCRWLYDGAADPVLIPQLVALIQGEAEAQAQSLSDTPDTTVACTPVPGAGFTLSGSPTVSADAVGTEILVPVVAADGGASQLAVRIIRLLSPSSGPAPPGEAGGVSATWRLPEGTQARGLFATASIR